MAENQDGQEKSHDPTSKRLLDARKKGQVARSRELNTMAVTLVGAVTLTAMGPQLMSGIKGVFENNFTLSKAQIRDPSSLPNHFVAAVQDAVFMLLPFFGVMMVVAILASVALGGFNFSTQAMAPKLSKLNPITGMKRVFSAKGLMELVKSLAKFLLVGGVAVALIWTGLEEYIGLGQMSVAGGIARSTEMLGTASIILASTLIVMALFDVPFQIWDHKRQLKMTDKEVKDEMKETDGRPEVKGRIRQLQREMAQRRMMQEVPNADVIVTNPTHYAVALKYDSDKMRAPIVLAKGADLVAANIRKVGKQHDVAIVEAPLLARAVYFSTELQAAIPAGLYVAVAQLLAYVFQLRAYQEYGGVAPTLPDEFPVPGEFKTESPDGE